MFSSWTCWWMSLGDLSFTLTILTLLILLTSKTTLTPGRDLSSLPQLFLMVVRAPKLLTALHDTTINFTGPLPPDKTLSDRPPADFLHLSCLTQPEENMRSDKSKKLQGIRFPFLQDWSGLKFIGTYFKICAFFLLLIHLYILFFDLDAPKWGFFGDNILINHVLSVGTSFNRGMAQAANFALQGRLSGL